ncbi:DNA mismatch repair protein MutL [Hyphopichia burtonii NRRL Y-1933]|uniref:DNA mismatch repair protein MutL n=1 Tax=Hyphopichia burtonii NRRL Y-1933 TaxID=984485 RepID=A0A1E4RJ07_9ASCO|nr:DNA mismatch repair protein MutL [Hyphopichia burtonii NRRL Y-1933]ODV67258.1 DNA mismatch repair protein MutL [Hyphopichia burtonii NRRL Y-1933]
MVDLNESGEGAQIKALDLSVVNKIAAGEIIIQPANALKELLENSIDAKSTMIDIQVKDGGLKLLHITDNGKGIHKNDLHLLCERFATSKLSKFEDLESIATYGFRGEALASISHISRLSVVTKTATSPLAYKAFYSNGKLATSSFKAGSDKSVEPKPIAGKDGTQIIVENLFYNVPSRLKAFRSKNDEFAKILDVIGRYAVHAGGVGFSCKKFGESHQVLSTRPQLNLKERIRVVFGTAVANELIDVILDGDEKDEDAEKSYKDEYGLIKVSGAVTNSNFNNKKRIQPVFFINHRLVSCDPLKRALSSIYQFFLPKGNQPFIYLSLEISPQNLDVNVHPTKREVRFLNEEEIIDIICAKVHKVLSNIDSSRKFKAQGVLFDQSDSKRLIDESISLQATKKYRQENKLVRVDALQAKLNQYLLNQSENNYQKQMTEEFTESKWKQDYTSETANQSEKSEISNDNPNGFSKSVKSVAEIEYQVTDKERVVVNFGSILDLKEEVKSQLHRPLTNIFNNSVYVGIVDETKRLCCFQYDVKLFLCDYAAVLNEFYYQMALSEFMNYGIYQLDEPVLIEDILGPIYKHHGDLVPIQNIKEKFIEMREMFKEYFEIGLEINEDDQLILVSLPLIMRDIIPSLSKLPFFIYRLGSSENINFQDEKLTFQSILKEIALLYIPESISSDDDNSETNANELKSLNNNKRDQLNNQLEHLVFPMIKRRFLATKNLLRDVVQIADLPGLYKVFERC